MFFEPFNFFFIFSIVIYSLFAHLGHHVSAASRLVCRNRAHNSECVLRHADAAVRLSDDIHLCAHRCRSVARHDDGEERGRSDEQAATKSATRSPRRRQVAILRLLFPRHFRVLLLHVHVLSVPGLEDRCYRSVRMLARQDLFLVQ